MLRDPQDGTVVARLARQARMDHRLAKKPGHHPARHRDPRNRRALRRSEDDVWAHIRAHAVPYNELHDRGYPSIGCAPCTRAVEPGEDARAGRWWWESAEHKECGLHRRPQTVAVTSIGRASST